METTGTTYREESTEVTEHTPAQPSKRTYGRREYDSRTIGQLTNSGIKIGERLGVGTLFGFLAIGLLVGFFIVNRMDQKDRDKEMVAALGTLNTTMTALRSDIQAQTAKVGEVVETGKKGNELLDKGLDRMLQVANIQGTQVSALAAMQHTAPPPPPKRR